MKKKLVWYLLFPLPFVACNHPGPEKKQDVIHLEKITRNTDVLAEHSGLKFLKGGFSGYELKDERFMRFYDLPVKNLRISVDDNQVHIQRLAMDLPKSKEAIAALKEQLSKTYGLPGGDSSNDFSSGDEGNMLVWKNDSCLVGMYTDKNFDTATIIENAPTLSVLLVKPEENNN